MKTISEVYILEHPFFNMGPKWIDASRTFLDLWKRGLDRVAGDENAYAIISKPTEPNVHHDYLEKLVKYAKNNIPRKRRDIVKNRFQKPIKSKFHRLFKKSDIRSVSIRGVYIFQGIREELQHFIKKYDVPQDRCFVDFHESDTGSMPFELKDLRTIKTDDNTGIILPEKGLSLTEKIKNTKIFLQPELCWFY